MRRVGIVLGALAGALVFAIYLPSLHGPFLYDDLRQIVNNANLHDPWDPEAVVFNGLRQIRVWQNLSFALNWWMSPGQAWSFKTLNLLVHVVNSGLVLIFLRRALADRPWVAVLAASLFLIHPLQVQSVTYAMGRVSLIQGFFYLLVLVLVSAAKERRWLVVVVIGLAQLGKESCVLLPAVVATYDLTIGGRNWRTLMSTRMASYVAAALLVVPAWWLLRDPVSMYRGTSGFDLFPVGEYLIAQLHYYAFYPYLILNPSAQAIIHPYPAFDAGIVVLAVAGLLVCAALVALAVRAHRRRAIVTFAVAFFFLSMAPTSSFVQMKNPFAEYRLYQANLLWVILIALGVAGLSRWVRTRVVIAAATALCLYFAVFAGFQSYLYGDSLRVYAYALAAYPGSSELNVLVGSQHEQRGEIGLAEEYFLRGVELTTQEVAKSARARFRLARLYVHNARHQEACAQLDAIDVSRFRFGPPPRPYFELRLQCLSALGRAEEAAATLRAAQDVYGDRAFDGVTADLPQPD